MTFNRQLLPGSSRTLRHNFINSEVAGMLLYLYNSVNSVIYSFCSFAFLGNKVGTHIDLLGLWLVVSHMEVLLIGSW